MKSVKILIRKSIAESKERSGVLGFVSSVRDERIRREDIRAPRECVYLTILDEGG
jgi:hypothetical protein